MVRGGRQPHRRRAQVRRLVGLDVRAGRAVDHALDALVVLELQRGLAAARDQLRERDRGIDRRARGRVSDAAERRRQLVLGLRRARVGLRVSDGGGFVVVAEHVVVEQALGFVGVDVPA